MKLKQVVTYGVDLTGKAAKLSAALMGAGFFAHALYYLLINPFTQCSFAQIIVCMALPMLVYGAWMILLRLIPLELTRVYGVLAAAACLLLAIQGFVVDGGFGAVLGLIWYLICGAGFILISFGYLPYRLLLAPAMLIPGVIRAISLISNIAVKAYGQAVYELSGVCVILALCLLSSMMYRRK